MLGREEQGGRGVRNNEEEARRGGDNGDDSGAKVTLVLQSMGPMFAALLCIPPWLCITLHYSDLPQMAKYNEDLKAPLHTETNPSPKVKVHRVEWRKVRGRKVRVIIHRSAN